MYSNGSGFATGATVTAFTNAAGTADPNVTATVSKVTSGQLTLSVAVTAPDTNTAVGYTVTNTDGGVDKIAASVPDPPRRWSDDHRNHTCYRCGWCDDCLHGCWYWF